jgi:uncharacterized protein YkwD
MPHTPALLRRSHGLWRLIAPLAVVAVTTTGCFAAAGGGGGGASGEMGQLLQRVNEVRASNGRGPLAWCPTLANAASKHSQDMSSHGFMGHVGSDGSTFMQRANAHGYVRWTRLTENVAAGQTSVDAVLATWLKSPLHAANILDPTVNHAGFARSGNYWTQMFGANGTC